MAHPVVWFEVLGKDGTKLQRFYGDLFGWKIKIDNPMNYGMVDAEAGKAGKGIPGGIGPALEGGAGGVTFYVECPDIEQSLKTATKLGAKVVMPAKKMPGGPTLALFDDPEGHTIGLVQSE